MSSATAPLEISFVLLCNGIKHKSNSNQQERHNLNSRRQNRERHMVDILHLNRIFKYRNGHEHTN